MPDSLTQAETDREGIYTVLRALTAYKLEGEPLGLVAEIADVVGDPEMSPGLQAFGRILARAWQYVQSVPYRILLRWLFCRLFQDGTYRDKGDYHNRLKSLVTRARKEFYEGWRPDILADETREAICRGFDYATPAEWLKGDIHNRWLQTGQVGWPGLLRRALVRGPSDAGAVCLLHAAHAPACLRRRPIAGFQVGDGQTLGADS